MKNTSGLRKAYHKLCTEFYDISKPFACPEEVAFNASILKGVQGPILEAMCGSGRLLLPLLRLGFEIDGLDNSAEMLESCEKRSLFSINTIGPLSSTFNLIQSNIFSCLQSCNNSTHSLCVGTFISFLLKPKSM